LTIIVRARRADHNLARVVAPPPPRVRDWQTFTAALENIPPQVVQARGFTVFNYTLIPLTEETHATPAIPFSCFDPATGHYADLTIPAVPVTVKSGPVPADLSVLRQAEATVTETEKEPVLRDLAATPGWRAGSLVPLQQQAWFPLLQLLPAGAFLGLWGWDRRRRYLEQHPDVVLRRRARRALRREWR